MKAFLLILLFSQSVYGEDEFMTFSFINDSDEKRFYSLLKEVSCPLCEGSSIAGSNAPIASDIKNKINIPPKNIRKIHDYAIGYVGIHGSSIKRTFNHAKI